jgi:hypothetical protein
VDPAAIAKPAAAVVLTKSRRVMSSLSIVHLSQLQMIQLAETSPHRGRTSDHGRFDEPLCVREFERRHQSRRNLRGNARGAHRDGDSRSCEAMKTRAIAPGDDYLPSEWTSRYDRRLYTERTPMAVLYSTDRRS